MDVVRLVTGARHGERLKTICCFLALFFLLISYYMIKPLRNSQFLKDFDPTYYLPLVYLVVAVLCFGATKVFNFFYARMNKYRLISGTYAVIMACKVAFFFLLFSVTGPASKAITVVFYFWGSVYFLLALPALWACINDLFSAEQSERCFGFIALGCTLGTVLGSELSERISDPDSPFSRYPTLISAAAMGLALGCILLAARFKDDIEPPKVKPRQKGTGFWADVLSLLYTPYTRALAIMVFCLAYYSTAVEFTSQKLIDSHLARQEYSEHFEALNQQLGGTKEQVDPRGFALVYRLKSKAPDKRLEEIAAFLRQNGLSEDQAPTLVANYADYRRDLEGDTRAMFSYIFKYQGILGMVMLTLISRYLFGVLGLRVAVMVMPVWALIVLAAFFFPLGLGSIQFILVVGGALNYSLNNATKEILYTATTAETKFKLKPLIEGPGQRVGDMFCSLVKLSLFGMVMGGMIGEGLAENGFLIVGFGLVAWWLWAIMGAGRMYDSLRRDHKRAEAVARH